MRRITATLVLAVLGLFLPLWPAAAAWAQDSSLPACCRAHGAHHCLMHLRDTDNGVHFRGPGCPVARCWRAAPVSAGLPGAKATSVTVSVSLAAQPGSSRSAADCLRSRRQPRAPPMLRHA